MAEVKPLVIREGRVSAMLPTDTVVGQVAADTEVLRQAKLYTDRRVGDAGIGGGSGSLDKKFRLRVLYKYDF
jgi:hypothetical protein